LVLDQFLTSLLAVAHVLAASLVTVHVLLTHREVRSSIGWIGLAWLSPFVGSSIYIAFGVNRVARRATEIGLVHRSGNGASPVRPATDVLNKAEIEGIVSLAKAGDSLSSLPLVPGNKLTLLKNGDEAYPAMLEAISGAKSTIAMSSYIFADDAVGRKFAEALTDAGKRGVGVKVLIDGIGSGYLRTPILQRLSGPNVEVEQFLHDWAPWKMSFINLRNHKKILIIDGREAFTGGMNVAQKNVTDSDGLAVQDIHARVNGPVVRQLMLSFAQDWEFARGHALDGSAWWPELKQAGRVPMRGLSSGPDESVGAIEMVLSSAVEQATERVRIVTPYFLPEDRLMEVIRRAALRGVPVDVIVPERSNHFYFDWAMWAHLAAYPVDGITYYLSPAPFDHSKLVSIDSRWAAIGSANWDARSMRLNFEFLLECYGGSAVKDIDAAIDEKIALARPLSPDMLAARPTLVKLRDASTRLFLPYL